MKKILIVEDDQIVANIYRNKLAVEGYQVEVALDGEAGMRLLSEFRPTLVLLDLMLPKVPGLEILRHIRSSEEFKTIPVVVFSNTYLGTSVQAAWKAGATKCITKASCTPRQLIDVLRTIHLGPADEGSGQGARSQSEGAAEVATQSDPDVVLQEQLKKRFSASLPLLIAEIRSILQSVLKSDSESVRLDLVSRMLQQIRAVTGGAGVAGFARMAQMSAAVEALVGEMRDKPANINTSTLRTIAAALDFLGVLLAPGELDEKEMPSSGNILVVDDDPVSRRSVVLALEKAQLNSVAIGNPELALELIAENKFDLIFLDIDMPAMNGLELCTRIRKIPAHAKTPVVFVTRLNDFDNRAYSTMSGGTDLIGKPFLRMELAVKALCHVLRARLDAPRHKEHARKTSSAALMQA